MILPVFASAVAGGIAIPAVIAAESASAIHLRIHFCLFIFLLIL